MRGTACTFIVVVLCLVAARRARAEEQPSVDDSAQDDVDVLGEHGNLRTRAETVTFDTRQRVLELSGNVRIDSPPFHLRSQHIKLTRTKLGIEVEGNGRLAFCPCLGTPLTVEFDKAFVAPPGDLIIRNPKVEVYGVPVLILPWFWLRSDEKPGVLPPDVAYRGHDGLFVGEGVHLPWKTGPGKSSLDLRGGMYPFHGFADEARLRTPSSTTTVRHDRLRGDDGLSVDARGASGVASWDADVLRGQRGVRMTTDLDAAAKPWDRASIEGALRSEWVTVASGVRAVTRRGGDIPDVESVGPVTTIRSSGSAAGHLLYDATVEGGALHAASDTTSFTRAEVGASAMANAGVLATSLSVRGAGDVVAESAREGSDRAAIARARAGVPLVRAYGSDDPLLHVIEPFVDGALLHAHGDDLLGTAPGRAVGNIDGTAATTSAGLSTTLGRWADRGALDLFVTGGAAYGSRETRSGVRPLFRGRASSSLRYFGATFDAADIEAGARGHAIVARVRLGRRNGLRVLANVADRDGVDPVLARALVDAPLEPSAGFLAREGTTGGAGVVVPWARWLSTSAGVDADAQQREIVRVRGGFELRDRCGCITLRANGSHRVGREGVDVWVALDFAADR